MLSLEEILQQIRKLTVEKRYDEIINLISDEALNQYEDSGLKKEKALAYFQLAKQHYDLKVFDKAIDFYSKSIGYNPSDADCHNNLGNSYYSLNEFDKAKVFYITSLKLNPNLIVAHINLGNTYHSLADFNNAVISYNKAIEIDKESVDALNGLGNAYKRLGDYKKALFFFDKAVAISPEYDALYYNRGSTYQKLENFTKALQDFKKYIELTLKAPDYFTSIAKSRIVDLKKLIGNAEYSAISAIVNKIKTHLLFNGENITHYTSLSVSKILILNPYSKFRLSEGAYLNDTSEGRELFNFLPPCYTTSTKSSDTIAKPFAPKPFIGSFVAETKHDDLTLWRMYGKEDKDEARGCALTIEREKFIESIKESLIPAGEDSTTDKFDEEFSFYRVAYTDKSGKQKFTIPGAALHEVKSLNDLMNELSEKIKKYLPKRKRPIDRKNLIELLNNIAYLFKSVEYQYENELRLVVRGTGITKVVNAESQPLRVYIDLVSISPLIKKITLGPKVERAEEWASAFYYSLDKQDFHPEILISRLPFK